MPPTKTFISSGTIKGGSAMMVDFINVGQGNAILVTFPNGNFLLVDCGSQATSTSGSIFKHAQSYITTVTGGNQINTVVITHGDTDHTAFIPYLNETKSPDTVFFGGKRTALDADVELWIKGLEQGKKTNVYRYKKNYSSSEPDRDYGSSTFVGNPHVYTLAANYQGGSPNSNSVVLLILYGNQGVLLTGDADWNTENFIISKIPSKILKQCTIFILGHHGSYYSTNQALLDATKPSFATISASGTNKSYAHPDCDTLEMVAKLASNQSLQHRLVCSKGRNKPYTAEDTTRAMILTATNGDIRYITDGNNYRILASSTGIPNQMRSGFIRIPKVQPIHSF